MNTNPSINGVKSTSERTTNNTNHSGLETERRVKVNNPATTVPSPRGHA